MTDRHSAIFQLLISGLLAQGVAALINPHSLCEHLKAGFIREAGTVERAAGPPPGEAPASGQQPGLPMTALPVCAHRLE